MTTIERIKWASTFCVRRHITDQSEYTLNTAAWYGAIGWTVAGYLVKDRAILTNFGL